MNHSDKQRIIDADSKRRAEREREIDELLALTSRASKGTIRSDVADAYVNPELVRGIGMVSPPCEARVTRRSAGRAGTGHWYDVTGYDAHKPAMLLRPMPTRGIAPGTENTSDGTATVRVIHSDGTSAVVPVSHYSKTHKNGGPRNARAPQVAPAHHKLTAADLAPIGDANH